MDVDSAGLYLPQVRCAFSGDTDKKSITPKSDKKPVYCTDKVSETFAPPSIPQCENASKDVEDCLWIELPILPF